MKQEAAQSIIAAAGQHQHIAATLDAAHRKRYEGKGADGGYRVRLMHRRTQRVLVIEKQVLWESVLQAWSEL